jgi:hypothetical protein
MRHAPGQTGNDAGASGREDGGCGSRGRKPARRGPKSGENREGRGEVGGEGGHGEGGRWSEKCWSAKVLDGSWCYGFVTLL